LANDVQEARNRAEANFKQQVKEQRAKEGAQAMAEYEAGVIATRKKTERLRALRLARDAAQPDPVPATTGRRQRGRPER
jgi:hypothetical protein